MTHKKNQGPQQAGGLRVCGWAAGAAACLFAAAAVAALLPEPLLRQMPGTDQDWQRAALRLGDYLQAPVADSEEARQLAMESVVYSSQPADYLTAVLDAQSHSAQEIECLALNVYFEARGESADGKRAVAHVVMNRVADSAFPSSVCAVIREGGTIDPRKCQFTWWCDERSNRPLDMAAWRESRAVAAEVYHALSEDLTGGALWYHADYVAPDWGFSFAPGPRIGRHLFYRKAPKGSRNAAENRVQGRQAPAAVQVVRPLRPDSADAAPRRAPLPSGPLKREHRIFPSGPSEATRPLPPSGG